MVAADPQELVRGVVGARLVRVVHVVDVPVGRVLVERAGLRLAELAVLHLTAVAAPAERGLPRGAVLGHVVGAVLDVPASLQDERPEAFFRELLGGPAAGNPGPDDDGVVRLGGLDLDRLDLLGEGGTVSAVGVVLHGVVG